MMKTSMTASPLLLIKSFITVDGATLLVTRDETPLVPGDLVTAVVVGSEGVDLVAEVTGRVAR